MENEQQTPVPQQQPKKTNVALIVVIIVFVILGIMALKNNKNASNANVIANIATGPYAVSDSVLINFNSNKDDTTGLAAIAVDEQSLSEFTAAAFDVNGSLDTLFEQNKLFVVPNGTKVRIVISRSAASKVRVLEGSSVGKEGWVNNAFLYEQ
ncbi:MAG: hypothetical protein V1907_03830 [Candidatus Kerfeldbacteria bacterium]